MSRHHKWACVSVAACAALLFVWAIALFWFRFAPLSRVGLVSNALALIIVWALGPAVWFAAEWKLWRSDPELATSQRHARDFWIGAGAVVLILSSRELATGPLPTPPQVTVAWNLVVDVIRVLAWPAIAAFGFVMFREPLTSFLQALGSRASKIGAFNVSIELGTLPEAQARSGPRLDDLKTESAMTFRDSTGSLYAAIANTSGADYVTVNLEDGHAWLTSRLFILATLIARVRPIKRIVFLAAPADAFVGHASPGAVSEALARRYPWLQEAYVRAHLSLYTGPPPAQPVLTVHSPLIGPLDPGSAARIMMSYLSGVQDTVQGAGAAPDWVSLPSYKEHAAWISAAHLQRDLGRALDTDVVKRDPAADPAALAKILLRHESAYVAVLDSSSRFAHLIDRGRAVDQVVRRELR